MTVQTSTTVATGIGNGVTTNFPVGFKFNRDEDLFVILIDTATEAVEQLALNSDYTVQGAGREEGGSITTTVPVPAGKTIRTFRIVDLLQLTDLRNQGKFFAEIHEDTFDLIVMMIQQQQEQLDRSVKVPIGSDTPADDLLAEFKADIVLADAAAALSVQAKNESQAIAAQLGDVAGAVAATEALRNETAGLTAIAESSAASAEVDADRAEAASNAAFVNADVKLSIEAGLTGPEAVEVGEQFQVLSADGFEYLRYRHDPGPVATKLPGTFPTSDFIKSIPAKTSSLNSDSDSEILHSEEGDVLRRTDSSGNLFIPGVPAGSVQRALSDAKSAASNTHAANYSDAVEISSEETGEVIYRQDYQGRVFIPGLPGSLQEALGYAVTPAEYRVPTAREKLTPAIKGMVSDLIIEGYDFIDPPALCVPNNMHVPDAIVSAFSVSETGGQQLNTPYGWAATVHPYLLEMRRPVLGYKYLMAETPHPGGHAPDENPVLYGTNDLQTFDLIRGIQQPFDMPIPFGSGWMPDVSLSYDPRDGVLYMFYPWEGINYRKTVDGRNWTPTEQFQTGAAGGLLSHTFLFNPADNLWHMFATDSARLRHYTSAELDDNWVLVSQFDPRTLPTNPFAAWHCEVKFMGDKYVCLANDKGDFGLANLYLGISSDGINWTFGPALINPQPGGAYKGSFIPEFDGDNMRLHIAWNRYNFPLTVQQRFFCEPTNWVDLTSL